MKLLPYALLLFAALALAACQPATPAAPEAPAGETPGTAYPPAPPAIPEPPAGETPNTAYPPAQQPQHPIQPALPAYPMPVGTAVSLAYIRIETPADGAILRSGQPVIVRGMGAGTFEGTVVVALQDAEGRQLAMQPAILQSPEAGTGGEGPWEVELTFSVDESTAGQIVAFSPSPKDGEDWLASDQIAVLLTPATGQPSLENTPWLLVSFAPGNSYNPLAAIYQATAQFNSAEGRLSGTAGCNSYNTIYTAEDDALTIATPFALTRMMCEQPQMLLEENFIAALEKVTRYEIAGATLTMYDAGDEPLLVFQVDPYPFSDTFTREQLGNIAYLSDFGEDGAVHLNGGQYRAPASEVIVTLSNFAAFGDLNSDGQEEAAVILVSTGGGTGTFYDLAVVKKDKSVPVNIAIAPLGDRVQIQGLKIENSEIVVSLLTHAPEDPMCCPTQHTVLYYVLTGEQLYLTKTEADK